MRYNAYCTDDKDMHGSVKTRLIRVISYTVMKILPELLDMIEGIFNLFKKDERSVK